MPQPTKFLDSPGLTLYDQNIKNYIDNIVENDIGPEIDAKADDSVFGASGSTHSKGLVPDPGATSGSTKFLREDGTWAVPSGGGGGGSGDVNVIESISVNNVAQTVDANKNVNITVPTVPDVWQFDMTQCQPNAIIGTLYHNGIQVTSGNYYMQLWWYKGGSSSFTTVGSITFTSGYVWITPGPSSPAREILTDSSVYTISVEIFADSSYTQFLCSAPYCRVATSISSGEHGYVTGDQVYDYVQANKGDANLIESISVNGTSQTITNKNVELTVPVAAQAMASGDTGYVTGDMLYTVMSDIETFLANY